MLNRDDISIIMLNKVEVEIDIISLYRTFPTCDNLVCRTVSKTNIMIVLAVPRWGEADTNGN